MKNIFVCLASLLVLILFSSENLLIGKKKLVSPPGTIWLRDSIFIDQRPVENVHYLEYEHWMRDMLHFNLECFKNVVDTLPLFGVIRDSIVYQSFCRQRFQNDSILVDYATPVSWSTEGTGTYLRSPATRRYPLINAAYQTAKAYCEWRTYAAMMMYATTPNENDRKKYYRKIKYRLPTQAEWEYALATFHKDSYVPTAKGNSSLMAQPFPVNTQAAKFVLSNISEMVAEYGIAKGWNFKNKKSYNQPDFTTTYQYPSEWLGFRCVCEVEDWPEEAKAKKIKPEKPEKKNKVEKDEEEENK
ncbi:MAG: SUMF1/EgtB/PvdO family nonheme iron enzyme [Bacteroidota bacterium]